MNGYGRLRTALQAVRRDLDEVVGEATNDAGTVTAVVGGRGDLRELVLDRRVFRYPDSRALSEDILGTVRSAARAAADEAYRLTTKALGGERR